MSLFIGKEAVAKAFTALRSRKSHPLFAGYLHLQQRSSELSRFTDLEPEFQNFYKRYFYVEDHPIGSSYIRLFTDKKANVSNLWMNDNIAGSYAPSSLRSGQPFRQVVEVSNKQYSLKPDHAEKALEFLLNDQKINVILLAMFLYRDFNFSDLSIERLISVFALDFGYSDRIDGAINSNFATLFDLDVPDFCNSEWIEEA